MKLRVTEKIREYNQPIDTDVEYKAFLLKTNTDQPLDGYKYIKPKQIPLNNLNPKELGATRYLMTLSNFIQHIGTDFEIDLTEYQHFINTEIDTFTDSSRTKNGWNVWAAQTTKNVSEQEITQKSEEYVKAEDERRKSFLDKIFRR